MEQTYSLAERSLFCYNGPEVTSVERPSIQLHGNRVAVFSDIHSNYYALEACYADACREGADCFVFLGDYVSGLAEPVRSLDLVYKIRQEYPTVCIRGNRERYMMDHKQGTSCLRENLHDSSYLFTYNRLREKDHAFFASIPFYDVVEINGVTFEIAHASRDSDRLFFEQGEPQLEEVFSSMTASYLLTGHTHKPYLLTRGDKTIINPGSVGMAVGADPLPQYVLLDVKDGVVTCHFRRVTYDFEGMIRSCFSSGLVDFAKYWAISDLYHAITGIQYTKLLLLKVYPYANTHPDVFADEQVWQTFALELGLHFTEEEILEFAKKQGLIQ